MNNSTKIAYYNVRGLTEDKWVFLTNLIFTHQFHLIFISETWYIDDSSHRSHPYTISISPLPPQPLTGRRHAGMIVLTHPSYKSTSFFTTSDYSSVGQFAHLKIQSL